MHKNLSLQIWSFQTMKRGEMPQLTWIYNRTHSRTSNSAPSSVGGSERSFYNESVFEKFLHVLCNSKTLAFQLNNVVPLISLLSLHFCNHQLKLPSLFLPPLLAELKLGVLLPFAFSTKRKQRSHQQSSRIVIIIQQIWLRNDICIYVRLSISYYIVVFDFKTLF